MGWVILVCLAIRDQDHVKPIPTSPRCRSEDTNKSLTHKNGQAETSHQGLHHAHRTRTHTIMEAEIRLRLNKEDRTKILDGLVLASIHLEEIEWMTET